MWNPFSSNRSDTQTNRPAQDQDEQDIPKRHERKFEHRGSGAFWHVFDYTDRKTGEVRDDLVAKRLKNHFIFPDYGPHRDPELTREVANYLRRERDHLHRSYDEELPNLIPKEKIIRLAPKGELHPAGTIISVQEKMKDFKTMDRFKIDSLEPEQREKLLDQLETFIRITKAMVDADDPEDPEFSHAIPDLTHLGNLSVQMVDSEPVLRMFDTNYVVPLDSEYADEQHLLLRNSYWLYYLEHHMLGRSVQELQADPFYRKTQLADTMAEFYPDVPEFNHKDVSGMFRLEGDAPVGIQRAREEKEKQDVRNIQLEKIHAKLIQSMPNIPIEVREYSGNKQIHIETSYGDCIISVPEAGDIETSEINKNPLTVRRRVKKKDGAKSEFFTVDENMIEDFLQREL